MTNDRLGRKRTPAQEAAIAARKNPDGILSRSHNIATDEESHNWYAAHPATFRGAIVARARRNAERPKRAPDPTRLSVRGIPPETKEWAKWRAQDFGMPLGAYLASLIETDRMERAEGIRLVQNRLAQKEVLS